MKTQFWLASTESQARRGRVVKLYLFSVGRLGSRRLQKSPLPGQHSRDLVGVAFCQPVTYSRGIVFLLA